MSSGGQRGIDISGITSVRIQTASDVTNRTNVRLIYQNFASTTGANAYATRGSNVGNDSYVQFLTGLKDCSSNCLGLPWSWSTSRSYRT